jgi:hypothetical protein
MEIFLGDRTHFDLFQEITGYNSNRKASAPSISARSIGSTTKHILQPAPRCDLARSGFDQNDHER